MTIALMFLTGVFARAAGSNAMKATTASAAWLYRAWLGQPEKPTISDHALIEEYSDTVAKHGVGSTQTQAMRDSNAGNTEFMAFTDSIDRVKNDNCKRRHPHQVMRWEDLEVGREYTSVHVRECDGRMFEYRRTFAGSFSGKPEESRLPAPVASHYEKMRFTVHLDGRMFDGSLSDKPSCLLWGGDGKPNTYSSVAYLLGENDEEWNFTRGNWQHQLLVPTDRWRADPYVTVDWEEERPCGKVGETVWMYDILRHEQLAAVIDECVSAAGEPVYYVRFIRSGTGGQSSCDLQRRSKLTVRRDSEPVDELCRKHNTDDNLKRRTDDNLRAIFG